VIVLDDIEATMNAAIDSGDLTMEVVIDGQTFTATVTEQIVATAPVIETNTGIIDISAAAASVVGVTTIISAMLAAVV
jgi:hypothetical protein